MLGVAWDVRCVHIVPLVGFEMKTINDLLLGAHEAHRENDEVGWPDSLRPGQGEWNQESCEAESAAGEWQRRGEAHPGIGWKPPPSDCSTSKVTRPFTLPSSSFMNSFVITENSRGSEPKTAATSAWP